MDRKIVEFLIAGKGHNAILRELKVGYRRVNRLREMAREYGYLDRSQPLPAYPEALFTETVRQANVRVSEADLLLAAHRGWIIERLKAGWRPITVFEELPVEVSRSSFYRFLSRHKLEDIGSWDRRRVIPEIVHRPGEALLLDWGKLRDLKDPVTGKKRTLWAFVGVLGYSRYLMVRLVWSNDVRTTLLAIESMFKELGGVPEKITSDNPKCFAIEASMYDPLLNPALERFAAHYGFLMECLPPRDPQKKGKVERLMPYVRRLYEAHGEEWSGVEESQTYLDKKLHLANERKHGTTGDRPIDRFIGVEASALKPLPELCYEIEEYSDGSVRKDGHVRFRSKYYSVDESFIGSDVIMLGDSKQVSIYHRGKLIEVHERLTDPNRSKSTKPHHLKPWERAMQDNSHYRKRAAKIGPFVEQMVTILIGQGHGFIDTRKIWGILSLDKTHEPSAINDACRKAIELESYSSRTVKNILSLRPRPVLKNENAIDGNQTQNTENANKNKFIRPISEYRDQLNLKLAH